MVRSPPLTVVLSSGKLMLAASSVATKLTVSVSPPPPPPPQGSGITMADELMNNGSQLWLSWFVIPSLNWQAVQFVLTDYGTCPKWAMVNQAGPDEIDVIGAATQPQTLISHPVAGTRSLDVGSAYTPVACTPGIIGGVKLSHQYSIPAFKMHIPAGIPVPFANSPTDAFMSYGQGTIISGGKSYQIIGTYEKWSFTPPASDPRPGVYAQQGWVSTSLFVLYFVQFPSFAWAQIWWQDTKQMENVTVSVAGTCPNFVYTVQSSRGTDTINVSIARFGTGNCPAGFGFGPATSKFGGAGIAMTNTDR